MTSNDKPASQEQQEMVTEDQHSIRRIWYVLWWIVVVLFALWAGALVGFFLTSQVHSALLGAIASVLVGGVVLVALVLFLRIGGLELLERQSWVLKLLMAILRSLPR